MTVRKPFYGISGSTLKLIAIITMFIDHAGATVLQSLINNPEITSNVVLFRFFKNAYSTSRDIGRIAFPIFCFLMVEGFIHTRNVWKYASRMLLFALISEIPFDLTLKDNWSFPGKQNVYFTLLIGLLVLVGLKFVSDFTQKYTCTGSQDSFSVKRIFLRLLSIVLCTVIIYAGMKLAAVIDTDYNYKGVLLIAVLYLTRDFPLQQCFTGALAVSWELPAPIGFLPVYLYNGTRGLNLKYVFYWFYPVHLLFLHVIEKYLIPLF